METKLLRQKIHKMRNHQHMIEMGLECLHEMVADDEAKSMLSSVQKNYKILSDIIESLTSTPDNE